MGHLLLSSCRLAQTRADARFQVNLYGAAPHTFAKATLESPSNASSGSNHSSKSQIGRRM